jgi:hypothetical protein
MSNIEVPAASGSVKDRGDREKDVMAADDVSYHVSTVNELGNVVDPILSAKINLVNEVRPPRTDGCSSR